MTTLDPLTVALTTALYQFRKGLRAEAVDTVLDADPQGFTAAYALAGVLANVPGEGQVVTEVHPDSDDVDYATSIAAFIAASGNSDVKGAVAVYFADQLTAGRMLADLLHLASALPEAMGRHR